MSGACSVGGHGVRKCPTHIAGHWGILETPPSSTLLSVREYWEAGMSTAPKLLDFELITFLIFGFFNLWDKYGTTI